MYPKVAMPVAALPTGRVGAKGSAAKLLAEEGATKPSSEMDALLARVKARQQAKEPGAVAVGNTPADILRARGVRVPPVIPPAAAAAAAGGVATGAVAAASTTGEAATVPPVTAPTQSLVPPAAPTSAATTFAAPGISKPPPAPAKPPSEVDALREHVRARQKAAEAALPQDPRSRLSRHLQKRGFRIQDVPGDNNCQFHAIADQLAQSGVPGWDATKLRNKAVAWLSSNGDRAMDDGAIGERFLLKDSVGVDDWGQCALLLALSEPEQLKPLRHCPSP